MLDKLYNNLQKWLRITPAAEKLNLSELFNCDAALLSVYDDKINQTQRKMFLGYDKIKIGDSKMKNGQLNISLEDIVNQSEEELDIKIQNYKTLLIAQGLNENEFDISVKNGKIVGFTPRRPMESIEFETIIDVNQLNS